MPALELEPIGTPRHGGWCLNLAVVSLAGGILLRVRACKRCFLAFLETTFAVLSASTLDGSARAKLLSVGTLVQQHGNLCSEQKVGQQQGCLIFSAVDNEPSLGTNTRRCCQIDLQ